jgi:hypothetical protein
LKTFWGRARGWEIKLGARNRRPEKGKWINNNNLIYLTLCNFRFR